MGMETTTNPVSLKAFKGLNTKFNDIGISPREATALKNVNIHLKRLTTRNGSALFTTEQFIEAGVSKAVTGIYQVILGGVVYRIVTAGTKAYTIDANGVVTADITIAVTLTDSQDELIHFASFVDNSNNDIVILASKNNTTYKWNGAGDITPLSGAPGNFEYLLVKNNRLWATVGDFLYHTDLLKGETYDALYWAARFKTAGFNTSDITALTKFGTSIFIGKEDAIYLLSGESIPTGYLDEVLTGDGVVSGSSVVEIPSTRYGNILAFYNKDGRLVGFDGSKNLIPLGEHVFPTLDNFSRTRRKYIGAVNYKALNLYVSTVTSGLGGTKHDKLVCHDYDQDGSAVGPEGQRESTMVIHDGLNINCLGIMDFDGVSTLFGGTYDGFLIRLDTGATDVTKAAQIDPAGLVRASNVVTVTTLAPHGFAVGETVVIDGSTGGFDGSFTIATIPTTTSFTYSQTGVDTSGGGGVAYIQADISWVWQTKKEDYGASAHQKQINDFDIVCSNPSVATIQVDAATDGSQASGAKSVAVPSSASLYGSSSIYGQVKYGGSGLSYNRVVFNTPTGIESLASRYFQYRFSGNDRIGIDEIIIGVTDLGYQPQNVDTA